MKTTEAILRRSPLVAFHCAAKKYCNNDDDCHCVPLIQGIYDYKHFRACKNTTNYSYLCLLH